MENSIYTVDHYINKLQIIPEEMWRVGDIGVSGEPRCVMGLCYDGDRYTEETQRIIMLFHNNGMIAYKVNNGDDPRYNQPTPKQRILAALYDIKAKQQPQADITTIEPKPKTEVKVIYKTVIIDEAVKNLQETLTEN